MAKGVYVDKAQLERLEQIANGAKSLIADLEGAIAAVDILMGSWLRFLALNERLNISEKQTGALQEYRDLINQVADLTKAYEAGREKRFKQ